MGLRKLEIRNLIFGGGKDTFYSKDDRTFAIKQKKNVRSLTILENRLALSTQKK